MHYCVHSRPTLRPTDDADQSRVGLGPRSKSSKRAPHQIHAVQCHEKPGDSIAWAQDNCPVVPPFRCMIPVRTHECIHTPPHTHIQYRNTHICLVQQIHQLTHKGTHTHLHRYTQSSTSSLTPAANTKCQKYSVSSLHAKICVSYSNYVFTSGYDLALRWPGVVSATCSVAFYRLERSTGAERSRVQRSKVWWLG